jgi:hypothetical protein
MAMAILLPPNRASRWNVLLRLSRLSCALAAAALLAFAFGPDAQRALCGEVGLVLAALALFLWRIDASVVRRRARADEAVPAPRVMDADGLRDALEGVEARIAAAPSFERALLEAGAALRGELGAASARALLVLAHEGGHAVAELIPGERHLVAAPAPLRLDQSPCARAVASARLALAWPSAAALPVVHGTRVVALVELRGFAFEPDDTLREALLARAGAALERRAAHAAAVPTPVRRTARGPRLEVRPC